MGLKSQAKYQHVFVFNNMNRKPVFPAKKIYEMTDPQLSYIYCAQAGKKTSQHSRFLAVVFRPEKFEQIFW